MIIDQQNAAVNQHTLADIHFTGVFIGVLKQPSRRINLFYWNRFLIEIHCEFEHQQWTPSKINHVLRTDAYMDSLKFNLTQAQFCKLQDTIRSLEVN
ncbi:hypothetical protein [Spirosoma gilvum]